MIGNVRMPPNANVISRQGDRVVFQQGNRVTVRKDDLLLLRPLARDIITRPRTDRYSETVVILPDGTQIVTVYDEWGGIIYRERILPNRQTYVLVDSLYDGYVERYPGYYDEILPPIVVPIPQEQYIVETRTATPGMIYDTLTAPPVVNVPQAYSINDVRQNERIREMVPRVDIDTITFEFGSANIAPAQIANLAAIGMAMSDIIRQNPNEVYLIEGHTDAVGSDVDNLALSDRRAEAVAMALTANWRIPPENLVTQGYGEQYLKIPTDGPEQENRRVTVRRITPLVQQDQQQAPIQQQ
ncbi:OmpA family protein [Faunimonas sp. B44]|uniref:OmpA family protein n=1 Tax=Faunimonas sp. B44 TaxID=3461493 RepID=UPI004044B55C